MTSLAPQEFALETTWLNTASHGLPAARSLAAVRDITERWAAGRTTPMEDATIVDRFRAACARLLDGASGEHIAIGSSVAALIAPVAAALPPGAEVLLVEGEFSSVSAPFVHRSDIVSRFVSLEELIYAVRPQTALVAVSVVQSADGRVIDLPRLRAAATANGARLLVDASQAAGWFPLSFADADYWVCATFKWLIGARSANFFAAGPQAAATLRPLGPGWYAAADRWAEMYHPVALADTTRRFDSTPDSLGVYAALGGLSLIEELGIEKIGAHNIALADSLRAGLTALGYEPVWANSAIVSVPGAGALADRLREADIVASARNGGLRFAFHLYNDGVDVERALAALGSR
ncbi:aminotransferase class V-fold PLP-dependent enzyme [Nocardia panacis]|uniref:Aminotransferase class V-fold PLP-dependent enzyme n=1 Tax=Nocardia panacis TaxID=2340916 RepID=A0A3A4K4Z4_9NOCA|nr:aminotransferase class V-fold PLP-dependent enzyme [Nocardia panacis]RJO73521.1 aminotransferase class V-fold PLP-dependent enzyme [Nocardia panacis]